MEGFKEDGMRRREFLKKSARGAGLIMISPFLWDGLRPRGAAGFTQQEEPLLGLMEEDLNQLLHVALQEGGDFADIYVERRLRRDIDMEEDRIASIQMGMDQGVGIRVVSGDSTGYAYSEDLSSKKLREAAETASFVARSGKATRPQPIVRGQVANNIPSRMPLDEVAEDERLMVIRRANEAARSYDGRITQVEIQYQEELKEIAIANSQGIWVQDRQPLIYFIVNVLATDGNQRHRGRRRISGHMGFELFAGDVPEQVGRDAAREAVDMLAAVDAPAGQMPVVVSNGWGGVLFHEAMGHGLEADGIQRGTSFYVGKVGQRVGSDLVTLVDDATVPNLRGSFNVDDEGTPAQKKVLIEKGVLRGYMYDILTGRQLGAFSTGNGRRQSFRDYPLVRMTNTYVLNGSSKPEEIFAETKSGLFAKAFVGGVVDTTSGSFTFTVREAYLIENGELTRPVKGATLIGSGPEVLETIDMVADDLDFAPGTCGKGQWVPVTSGQPTLRIGRITVGGTRA
jgi:TldD protein